ncbi:MAG: DUF4402 domain-containing protein [Bacteroidota bacterium]
MKKIAIYGLLFLSSIFSSFAQVTVTGHMSAEVVAPVGIDNTSGMHFGNVAINNGGTRVFIDAGANTRTANGVNEINTEAGTWNRAAFSVSGQNDVAYAITLPSNATTIDDNFGHRITIDNWTSYTASTTNAGSGNKIHYIGANLTVGQQGGIANTGSDFRVTVNYN